MLIGTSGNTHYRSFLAASLAKKHKSSWRRILVVSVPFLSPDGFNLAASISFIRLFGRVENKGVKTLTCSSILGSSLLQYARSNRIGNINGGDGTAAFSS